jgi:hypothetical protein
VREPFATAEVELREHDKLTLVRQMLERRRASSKLLSWSN